MCFDGIDTGIPHLGGADLVGSVRQDQSADALGPRYRQRLRNKPAHRKSPDDNFFNLQVIEKRDEIVHMGLNRVMRNASARKPMATLVMQDIGVRVAQLAHDSIPDSKIGAERIDEGNDRLSRCQTNGPVVDCCVVNVKKIHLALLLSRRLQDSSG